MLPYIIHNTIFKKDNLSFLRNFDVLEKATNITNEVFIGALELSMIWGYVNLLIMLLSFKQAS